MENKNSQNNESQTNGLNSTDLKTIRAAIKKLRKQGTVEDVPFIIQTLKNQDKEEIKKELHSLLCDIQLSGFQPYMIEAIENPANKGILSNLISVCWENKQDFSAYLDVFVRSFLNSEYKTSIEAFTMIEKVFTDYDYTNEKLLRTIKTIKLAYPDLTENKRELAMVLLDILDRL